MDEAARSHRDKAVSAQLDRIEGRKLHLSATISADGQVTVDADAIFLTLTTENLESVFDRDRAAVQH